MSQCAARPAHADQGLAARTIFTRCLWLQDYQAFVDAEWKIIYDKLDAIVATGAKVVLSRLAIGDLATQYFADRDIFCAGRVTEDVSGTNSPLCQPRWPTSCVPAAGYGACCEGHGRGSAEHLQ